MKSIIPISFTCSLLTFFSCKRTDIKTEILDFEKTPIVIPLDSMRNATFHEVNPYTADKITTDYIIVNYIDSTMCTECAISHLKDWALLQEKIVDKRISMSYAFIITPPKYMIEEIKKILTYETEMNSFIYLDTLGLLEKRNPNFPRSKSLHTFLLDKNGKVLLVGNPVRNDKIEALMFKILEKE